MGGKPSNQTIMISVRNDRKDTVELKIDEDYKKKGNDKYFKMKQAQTETWKRNYLWDAENCSSKKDGKDTIKYKAWIKYDGKTKEFTMDGSKLGPTRGVIINDKEIRTFDALDMMRWDILCEL